MKNNFKFIVCFAFLLLFIICLNISVFAEEKESESSPEETESQTTNENNYEADKQIIIIGDSYAMGYSPADENVESWAEQVADKVGITDSILVSASGVGFVKSVEGISFTSLLYTAWEQAVDPASVSDIVVCGGYNDQYYDSATILYSINSFLDQTNLLFPNSTVHIGMIGFHENNSVNQYRILNRVLPAYRQAAQHEDVHYISGCEYVLMNHSDVFTSDNIHPNQYGQSLLADYIFNSIDNNDYYCGLSKIDDQWYWIENSTIDFDVNGLRNNEYGTWVVENGTVDFQYNGFVFDNGSWWYAEDGKVTFDKTDIIKGVANTDGISEGEEAWWYINNSKVMNVDTVAKNKNGWWAVKEGKVDFQFSGLQRNEYGWWYINNGEVDFNYFGFAANYYGWWYLENGKVNFDKNDILKGEANLDPDAPGLDAWWFIIGGRVTSGNTVAKNKYGWWYINKGKVDFEYTGFANNENGWWFIENGMVRFQKNGIIYGKGNTNPKAYGSVGWWYVQDGKIIDISTVAQNEYGWWYIRNGRVDYSYTGIAKNAYGWWRIVNGQVDFNCNSVEENEYGWWYIHNGKVDFNYNGIFKTDSGVWYITNGKASLIHSYNAATQ